MVRKTLTLLFAGLMLASLGTSVAHPQTYPAQASIEVRDANGNLVTADTGLHVGDPMHIFSTGWMPGSTVSFTFLSEPILLGTQIADSKGEVRAVYLVPNVEPGMHTLRLTGIGADGKARTVDYPIRVLPNTAVAGATQDNPGAAAGNVANGFTGSGVTNGSANGSGSFGKTGADHIRELVAGGIALLAVGAALVLGVRRTRRA